MLSAAGVHRHGVVCVVMVSAAGVRRHGECSRCVCIVMVRCVSSWWAQQVCVHRHGEVCVIMVSAADVRLRCVSNASLNFPTTPGRCLFLTGEVWVLGLVRDPVVRRGPVHAAAVGRHHLVQRAHRLQTDPEPKARGRAGQQRSPAPGGSGVPEPHSAPLVFALTGSDPKTSGLHHNTVSQSNSKILFWDHIPPVLAGWNLVLKF